MNFAEMMQNLWNSTGISQGTNWQNYVMLVIAGALLFVGIGLKKEPLLLVPIAFGMLLVNIPGGYDVLFQKPTATESGGLLHYLNLGVSYVIYPPLIFLGVGAMTDFGPLIANPKSFILGAGAQLGIFITFFGAILFGFEGAAAASIAIIGGADGPTAIYLTTKLGQVDLLPTIAIAAYSYMALIPIIQPPIMKLLTTKKERQIVMKQQREVTKKERVLFPIIITVICGLILPTALPLLGMLMFGNLLKESLVTDRLADTASNSLMNIITILLGICVGAKSVGTTFLSLDTLKIILLGLVAFMLGTSGGILMAKFLNLFSKNKINPLIGAAGVSAVPMASRVAQSVASKEDPQNFILMHAMGPNVAGVIGSAVAAGILLAIPW